MLFSMIMRAQESVHYNFRFTNMTLREVLTRIEMESNYRFFYSNDLSSLDENVNMIARNVTINELLNDLLNDYRLTYHILEDQLILIVPSSKTAGFTIEGTIRDASTGNPLIGANILVEGTNNGTTTNLDGNFKIKPTSYPVKLICSYVGFMTSKIDMNKAGIITVNLLPDKAKLDEVMILGYGKQKKIDFTGAVSTVSGSELERIPESDPLIALQGRAAGLYITQRSGQPGAGSSVRIRGIQSINASNTPIFVIDGIITNNLNQINFNDIESVSVLKDASATAIYGARAANGVLVIKTKQGNKNSSSNITFNTYQAWQVQSNLKLKLLNAKEYIKFDKESYINAGLDIPFTNEDLNVYKGIDTDWLSIIRRTGRIKVYDLSLSGGGQHSEYYISAKYFDQKGIVLGTAYKKLTFRINSTHQINDYITFGNNLNIFNDITKGFPDISYDNYANTPNPYLTAIRKIPVTRPYENDGNYGYIRNSIIEHRYIPPHLIANEYENTLNGKGVLGNLYLKLNIGNGLTFTPRLNINYIDNQNTRFIPSVNILNIEGNNKNHIIKERNSSLHWTMDYLLNYSKVFFEKHELSVLAAYTQEESKSEVLKGSRYGTPNNHIRYIDSGEPEGQMVSNNFYDWAFVSYIGRINYIFNKKYIFNTTLRRDGSSRFSKENRWGWFPSYGAAWKIYNESFFPGNTPFNELKLRMSWGKLGNSEVGFYPTYTDLTPLTFVLNNTPVQAFTVMNAANKDVRWETTNKFDTGMDAELFKSKLYFSADYFIENTYNLLFLKPIPLSAGIGGWPYVNVGKMQNKGFEIEIGFKKNTINQHFNVSFNFSRSKNRILDLGGQNLESAGLKVGYPAFSFYGYKTAGIIKNRNILNNYPQKPGADMGDIWVLDIDGYDAEGNLTGIPDGIISPADRTLIGNKFPNMTSGLTLNYSYKNWSTQLMIQGVFHFDLPVYGQTLTYYTGNPSNQDTRILDRWDANENPDGNMPRIIRTDPAKNSDLSDFWYGDASYIRINNFNINYSIPKPLSNKLLTSKLDIYASIENLFTITKFPGPEVDISPDFSWSKIPTPRTWAIGVKASF